MVGEPVFVMSLRISSMQRSCAAVGRKGRVVSHWSATAGFMLMGREVPVCWCTLRFCRSVVCRVRISALAISRLAAVACWTVSGKCAWRIVFAIGSGASGLGLVMIGANCSRVSRMVCLSHSCRIPLVKGYIGTTRPVLTEASSRSYSGEPSSGAWPGDCVTRPVTRISRPMGSNVGRCCWLNQTTRIARGGG